MDSRQRRLSASSGAMPGKNRPHLAGCHSPVGPLTTSTLYRSARFFVGRFYGSPAHVDFLVLLPPPPTCGKVAASAPTCDKRRVMTTEQTFHHTFQFRAYTSGAGYQQLDRVMAQQCVLYYAALGHRRPALKVARVRISHQAQRGS